MNRTEDLVMTASKRGHESHIRIDRQPHAEVDLTRAHHVAKGPFKGIIVNKTAKALQDVGKPDIKMAFMVHMNDIRQKQGKGSQEIREIRFWFKSQADQPARNVNSKEYFKSLLQPEDFPRDYVNFIKKAIVLTQHFPAIKRIDLIMRPEVKGHDTRDSGYVDTGEEMLQKSAADSLQTEYTGAPRATGPYEDMVDEDEDSDDDVIENFITVLTPSVYDYQYLPEVSVSDKVYITFKLRAKADGHLALSSVYGDTERKTYEIVLGGWDNTRSVIRLGGQGDIVEEAMTPNLLDGYDFKQFWASWDKGMIQVGEGRRKGADVFLRWRVPPHKHHSVNCLAVSSGPASEGEWEFVEIIKPSKSEDESRSARRAKFRLSLLWLAKKQRMLQVLEDAYPNSVNTADLLRLSNIKLNDMMTAVVTLKDLHKRKLITEVQRGIWMRSPGSSADNKHEVKMVETMPLLTGTETPTIAVITALYCEKLAVDAMMDTKTSYVKYKTEGESNVYTVGRMGRHVIVCTKLSRVGSAQSAIIATGSTVTRLLGIFDKVAHVILVGVGGAVPNYHDYDKHVRLGDIVVGVSAKKDAPSYIHCENLEKVGDSNYTFTTRDWVSTSEDMCRVIEQIREQSPHMRKPWERYIDEGNERLHSEESNFHRPPVKKDKLFAVIDNEVVQVEHPKPPHGDRYAADNKPRARYGPIGSSKFIARNDRIRMGFAQIYGIVGYDAEFGAVLDAVEGSKRGSFLVIRGISDYIDGGKNKEWQPYASLAAAAYLKAVLAILPAHRNSRY